MTDRRTLISVNHIFLVDDTPAVNCTVHLRLPPHLAQVLGGIPPSGAGALSASDAQNMATKEFVRGNDIGQRGAALRVAGSEENGGGRNEEDVLTRGVTLGGDGAFGEAA
jgi:hypothetical protein